MNQPLFFLGRLFKGIRRVARRVAPILGRIARTAIRAIPRIGRSTASSIQGMS